MSENNKNLSALLSSNNFLISSCVTIFLLSIWLRSILGIGPDSGFYLDLGQKIALGEQYYYDFFEGNFPLSFYFYALQFHISKFLHINPIYLSEILVNIFGIFSIFFSAKFLRKTTIYNNKTHYNLIIIAFSLAYFLRIGALEISEFGTKTTFLFALLFPYISSSFVRKIAFSKPELIWRGIFMGLIPCLKPHYLVLIIFIEFYNFWQKRNFKFFLELDKLIMALIGCTYLFLMIKFIPEFFEFIIPMQNSFYYSEGENFLSNISSKILWNFAISSLIFLLFSRLKFSQNDLVLSLFLFATFVLIAIENITTIDQLSVFYAIVTICYSKWIYDLFFLSEKSFNESKLVIFGLIFFSFLVSSQLFLVSFIAFFYWIILPLFLLFLLIKKLKNNSSKKLFLLACFYLILLSLTFLSFKYLKINEFYTVSLISLFLIIFLLEKFILNLSENFSSLAFFLIISSIFWLFGSYIFTIFSSFSQDGLAKKHNQLIAKMTNYSQIYAPEKQDKILVLSNSNLHTFPFLNYLGKENFYIGSIHTNLLHYSDYKKFLYSDNYNKLNTIHYLFDDFKERIRSENLKVLFVNSDATNKGGKFCNIGSLEYYFHDLEFRKIFLQNFHFKGRILISDAMKQEEKFLDKSSKIFNKTNQPKNEILYDFEVYVRKEKQN